jgi:Putative zinc-finger
MLELPNNILKELATVFMSRNARKQKEPSLPALNHDKVQEYLMAYLYGRLPSAISAQFEAHTRNCARCHAEGLGHLATERVEAMQIRAKSARRSPQRLIVLLSSLLVLLLCAGGMLIFGGASQSNLFGIFQSDTSSSASRAKAPTVPPSPTIVPTPVALQSLSPLGVKGTVTVAASPDSKYLAVGINPAYLGGTDIGGVFLYDATGKLVTRLPGFDGYQAPGTLSWSADGKFLAGSGRLSLIIWQVSTASKVITLNIPENPGNILSVFDITSGTSKSTVPATIFSATGFAQWDTSDTIVSATPPSPEQHNLPALDSSLIALWSSQQGIRIFRDANNATLIGMNDDDRKAHAALLRWSPDNHAILWGYPSLPISTTLVSTSAPSSTPGVSNAVASMNVTVAMLANHVGDAKDPHAFAFAWPATDGTRLVIYDATGNPSIPQNTFVLCDHQGNIVGTLPQSFAPSTLALNMVSWQSPQTMQLVITPYNGPIGQFAAG